MLLDTRIAALARAAEEAVVVPDAPASAVGPDTRVTLREVDGTEDAYAVVGAYEPAPDGRSTIPLGSRLGRALLGKRRGERVAVEVDGERVELTVAAVAPLANAPSGAAEPSSTADPTLPTDAGPTPGGTDA